MSVLQSPIDSPHNNDHSHFFANSDDDDAETASQRSISLSSPPQSPKRTSTTSNTLMTPISNSFAKNMVVTKSPSPPPAAATSPEPVQSDEDHESHSTAGTTTSGPSSFKFDEEGHTRQSSMSSSTSFSARDEESTKPELSSSTTLATGGANNPVPVRPPVDTTYPPRSQAISPVSDFGYNPNRASLASAKTGISADSSTSSAGGRKVRPESTLLQSPDEPLVLGIALVDFNHVVGPRVEFFEGKVFEDEEIIRILPFLALPDGAHLSNEDYSYFHLVPSGPKPITVFGVSCNRQIHSSELLAKGEDVTRSTVQKAVVVLASKPVFGAVRDKLGVVTNAFFNQRDFREVAILTDFLSTLDLSLRGQLTESGLYMGTSLRELVQKFRHRTLILLKALILQRKIMFYGHPVERLCTYQYSLISLIPCLLQTLEDCGSPPLAARAPTLSRPSSLRTSDRKSMLTFMGLPLDIFGKDAFFQPYLPLQQVDIAKDTSSWLCGCTNSIVYTQSNYDLLVNLESNIFEFKDAKLEKLVALSPADRKWIDDIVKDVNDTWNDSDPTRPTGMQFKGSDDYLRTKFEEYISALLSTVKYSDFLAKGENSGVLISEGYDRVCVQDFGQAWIAAFRTTQAYEVWNRVTDPVLFDIIEPRHPCIDKPSAVSDIGLQLSETIRDLKIEQQLAPTREAISNALTTGSTSFFKAVDGIKGRWSARSASTSSVKTVSSSTSTSTAVGAMGAREEAKAGEGANTEVDNASAVSGSSSTNAVATSPIASSPVSSPSTTSTPASPRPQTSRPPSVVAAEAKATIGAWGSGIGSFFASRASRFSRSRSSVSSIMAVNTAASPPQTATDAKPSESLTAAGDQDTKKDNEPSAAKEIEASTPTAATSVLQAAQTAGEPPAMLAT